MGQKWHCLNNALANGEESLRENRLDHRRPIKSGIRIIENQRMRNLHLVLEFLHGCHQECSFSPDLLGIHFVRKSELDSDDAQFQSTLKNFSNYIHQNIRTNLVSHFAFSFHSLKCLHMERRDWDQSMLQQIQN